MDSVNRGVAWKHFAIVIKDNHGNRTGSCNYCTLKFTGSHGRFAAHFNPDNKSIRTCTECPNEVLSELSVYHKECTKKKESKAKKKRLEELTAAERVVKKQKRLSDVCNRYAGSEVDNQLGKAIFSAGLPFEMVENREFKKYGKLRQRAGENYKEPCAQKIGGSILNNVQRELKFELQERDDAAALRTGVTVNLDAGEDVNRHDVVATFHITTEGERFERLYDTDGVERDTEWYAKLCIETIQSCPGGPKNCFHICVDAGTPGVRGTKDSERLQTLVQEEFAWVTVTLCQMHQGNLFCKDIFKIPVYADSLNKLHGARMWIKQHHWSYAQYRRSGGFAIQKVSETRAVGQSIECAKIIRDKLPLKALYHSEVFGVWVGKQNRLGTKGKEAIAIAEAHRTNITDPMVWMHCEEAFNVSEPAIKIARIGDSSKPTMGIVLHAWQMILHRINEYPMATTAPTARNRELKNIYMKRKEAALSVMHHAAFAVEPLFVDINMWDNAKVMDGFNTVVLRMSLCHPLGEEAAQRATTEFQIFRAKQGCFASPVAWRMANDMPSYQWFQQFGASVPHLQWFAVRILAMVSGGAAPERFYSKLGWIKNTKRNRLGHAKTEKVMWVHLNLALKKKLHDTDYLEEKATHTLDDSLLTDAGVEIEPLTMLENMVEEPDDSDDEEPSMHRWGMNWGTSESQSPSASGEPLSRSASMRSATSSM